MEIRQENVMAHGGGHPEERIVLEHMDWVRLILGTDGPPPKDGSVYGNIENPYYTQIGSYVGGFTDTWKWDKEKVSTLPTENLRKIYYQIDKGWKEYEYKRAKEFLARQEDLASSWEPMEQAEKIIIVTSENGHRGTEKYWPVMTNFPIDKLKELDLKYGGDGRFNSTTIDDLQEAAISLGFLFEHGSPIEDFEGDVTYGAITGNY